MTKQEFIEKIRNSKKLAIRRDKVYGKKEWEKVCLIPLDLIMEPTKEYERMEFEDFFERNGWPSELDEMLAAY